MKKVFVLFLIFTASSFLYPENIPLFLQKAVENFKKIKSVRAEVDQKVIIRGREFYYSGNYVASFPGIFKVTYFYPQKQIIWLGKDGVFNWYIPSKNLLYYVLDFVKFNEGTPSRINGVVPSLPSLQRFSPSGDTYKIAEASKRFIGFLHRVNYIRLEPRGRYSSFPGVELYITTGEFLPLRIIMTKNGKVIGSQFFKKYKKVNGVFFPFFVRVEVKKINLVTETSYMNVEINPALKKVDFKVYLPDGVVRKNLISAGVR